MNSSLRLEIVQTTSWVLDMVDNWCFYLIQYVQGLWVKCPQAPKAFEGAFFL